MLFSVYVSRMQKVPSYNPTIPAFRNGNILAVIALRSPADLVVGGLLAEP
jgi:hypothetical protein